MSYWVYLMDGDEAVEVTRHSEGGTFVLGGTDVAELNVTYNYSGAYSLCDFSIRGLHLEVAGDTISKLQQVVKFLGVCKHTDYWRATPGNAGHAANILLRWARQHPDAVWRVS